MCRTGFALAEIAFEDQFFICLLVRRGASGENDPDYSRIFFHPAFDPANAVDLPGVKPCAINDQLVVLQLGLIKG